MIRQLKDALFGKSKVAAQFDQTLSTKIACGDRVRHRGTQELGTCIQTGTVEGSMRVPALSVRYDSGIEAWLVPAEEFTKAVKPRY
jgi:hypothetical protein